MLLDARYFEKYLKVDELAASKRFRDVSFNSDGSVSLRMMAAHQFSGIARLQFDAQDNQMILPGSVAKVHPSDPCRFREGEAFRLQTHLIVVKPLPKDVSMIVAPCVDLLSLGASVNGVFEAGFVGVIEVILFAFRRIEVSYGYVVANLYFRECETRGGQRGRSKSSKKNDTDRSKK